MCKFKSAIVLKNGDILHNGYTDSHEDLMEYFKIKDDNQFWQNFVRIEFSPDKPENLMDVNSYLLKIDEDSTPDWFEEIKGLVIERMKDVVSSLFINQDEDIIIGKSIILGKVNVKRLINCFVINAGYATIQDAGYATVQDAWYATIKNAGYATIKNAGYATIQDAWYATIQDAGHATIQDAGHATIKNAGYATIKNAGYATIQDAGHATIQDAGYATVQDAWYATIKNAGYATIQDAGYATIQDAWYATIQDAWYATIQDAGYATIDGIKHRDNKPIK
jgi:hypothetical protein